VRGEGSAQGCGADTCHLPESSGVCAKAFECAAMSDLRCVTRD
jgi:hypothetical protein